MLLDSKCINVAHELIKNQLFGPIKAKDPTNIRCGIS